MMKFVLFLSALLATSVFALVPPAAIEVTVSQQQQHPATLQNPSADLQKYMNSATSVSLESSTLSLSLKERPPPPTAEELAAKKRNFNLWFWVDCGWNHHFNERRFFLLSFAGRSERSTDTRESTQSIQHARARASEPCCRSLTKGAESCDTQAWRSEQWLIKRQAAAGAHSFHGRKQ
eukprot:scaffold7832_cov103-Cylindrotheca_fusiformis.AAC.4